MMMMTTDLTSRGRMAVVAMTSRTCPTKMMIVVRMNMIPKMIVVREVPCRKKRQVDHDCVPRLKKMRKKMEQKTIVPVTPYRKISHLGEVQHLTTMGRLGRHVVTMMNRYRPPDPRTDQWDVALIQHLCHVVLAVLSHTPLPILAA